MARLQGFKKISYIVFMVFKVFFKIVFIYREGGGRD